MFATLLVHNQNDYWELNHKVYFDPIERVIKVYKNTASIDIKLDLYSAMKEWMKLPQRYNLSYKPPIRVIGGDTTTGSQTAGDIYFMQNGWKVSYDPTKVQVTGVLFSDNFDTAWIYSETGDPVYPIIASSLVTSIAPSLTGLNIPSATQNATAVRSELTTELANMDTSISSRATQTSVDNVQTTTNNIETKVDAITVTVGNMSLVINTILKHSTNKSIIDLTTKTLTIYDDDGLTPLVVFDLKDSAGVASITDIYQRIPQ